MKFIFPTLCIDLHYSSTYFFFTVYDLIYIIYLGNQKDPRPGLELGQLRSVYSHQATSGQSAFVSSLLYGLING